MSATGESSPVDYEYERLEPIPVVYGYLGVAASALFFLFVNQILVWIGNPKSVKEKDEWKYRNLLVSWIHAVLIGVWDLSWLVIVVISFSGVNLYRVIMILV